MRPGESHQPRGWTAVAAATLLAVLASGCATLRASGPPLPQPVPPDDVEVEWYDISGQDEDTLRAELNAKGPTDAKGRRSDAYTAWRVTWSYPFAERGNTCSTGPILVTLETKYTLPRWVSQAAAAPSLQERWKQYLAALLTHEDGHRQHGQDARREVEATLGRLGPEATCDEMDARANAEGERVLDKYRALDAAYDEETKHGETQGAVFP
ncbi:MAG: DUF922 domain-containing protein [Myxococcota bacterium]